MLEILQITQRELWRKLKETTWRNLHHILYKFDLKKDDFDLNKGKFDFKKEWNWFNKGKMWFEKG